MPAESLSLDNAYNARLRKMIYDLDHVQLIQHQPQMLTGGGPLMKYSLPTNTGSYPPIEKLAELSEMGGGGMCRCEGGKVNRAKKGKKWTDFALNTAEKGIGLAKAVSGGKVNRAKKARKWANFAEDVAKKGIGLAKEVSGGKVNRLKKATKWANFAEDVVKKGIGLAKSVGGKSPWIAHVKDYSVKHGVSYKEALSKAKASYKK